MEKQPFVYIRDNGKITINGESPEARRLAKRDQNFFWGHKIIALVAGFVLLLLLPSKIQYRKPPDSIKTNGHLPSAESNVADSVNVVFFHH
jgi:hypothetical protein